MKNLCPVLLTASLSDNLGKPFGKVAVLGNEALVPLNVQTRVREQFFWTSRLERVMLLLSSTYLSPGGDHDLNPHTMPLL